MLMISLVSVIIRDFYIVGIAIEKTKANAPLVVDGDRKLSLPIPFELMKAISRRDLQVIQASRQIDILELPDRPTSNVRRKSLRPAEDIKLLRGSIGERLDHRYNVYRHVTLVNWPPDRLSEPFPA
jgi:hypothetical protein